VSLNSLLGDWVFRDEVFGRDDGREYLVSLLNRGYLGVHDIPVALSAKRAAAPFLDACESLTDWARVKVLGLIDTYSKRDAVAGQLMSSLALAKRLKCRHPHLQIILAGPHVEREMGAALDGLPFLDYVFTKSIYPSLPNLISSILEGTARDGTDAARRSGVLAPDPLPERPRLELPIPDFDDYYSLKGDGLPGCFDSIPMETSKGCWWAERNHCRFCALPGSDVRFRSKSPQAALQEFHVQVERYRPQRIEMHDLIIDQRYFAEVFPALKAMTRKPVIFYETKAHLRRAELEILAHAGVTTIQAGIESLSPVTLRLMSKGVSAERNIAFLEACNEYGVNCFWNYLHSFPGESAAAVRAALPLIESIRHLQPPTTFQPVRLERFSPYFRAPARYGIVDIQPDRSYRFVYAGSGIDLGRFAFYFEHRQSGIDERERDLAVRAVWDKLEAWALNSGRGEITVYG
jgi:ribosomal peptide maturation radical SAM protein 1